MQDKKMEELFNSFKEIVSDNKLSDAIKQGLEDIEKYDFENNSSLHKSDSYDFENFYLLEKISLKNHTLNLLELSLNTLKESKNNRKDRNYDDVLLESFLLFFYNFGKSKKIKAECPNENIHFSLISKRYIEERIYPLLKDNNVFLGQLESLVELFYKPDNKIKDNNFIDSVNEMIYKIIKIEVSILSDRELEFNDRNLVSNILNKEFNEKEKERLKELISIESSYTKFNLP